MLKKKHLQQLKDVMLKKQYIHLRIYVFCSYVFIEKKITIKHIVNQPFQNTLNLRGKSIFTLLKNLHINFQY